MIRGIGYQPPQGNGHSVNGLFIPSMLVENDLNGRKNTLFSERCMDVSRKMTSVIWYPFWLNVLSGEDFSFLPLTS